MRKAVSLVVFWLTKSNGMRNDNLQTEVFFGRPHLSTIITHPQAGAAPAIFLSGKAAGHPMCGSCASF